MNTRDPADSTVQVTQWLHQFASALTTQDTRALGDLLAADAHWRDLLAFSWNIETHNGFDAITSMLARRLSAVKPVRLRLAERRTAPRRVVRAGREVIEAIFEFETADGHAEGVLRLVPDSSASTGLRAWIVLTALRSLASAPAQPGAPAPATNDYSRDFGGENWLDKRNRARAYADHDPAVLVIGAGQAGLAATARLNALGIDTLIIDRNERIGDNWRKRYHALTLHNEVHVNHLPFMPFPPNWPVFIPKDKLANWFEAYVESLELNCWTASELVEGSWHEADQRWHVTVRRGDGTRRSLKPRHLIFATGVSAMAQMPNLPGLDTFGGTVLHSGQYTEGAAWKGRKVLVLGTGNSGHDVAQDLHSSGAHVTLIQRSPTYVVSIREAQRVYALYAEGIPIDDCDLIATAMPYPVLRDAYQLSTAVSREADRALLEGLTSRGFRLTFGDDDTGFQMLYLRRGGGYYFNVGCSDLIVDGRIGLLQFGQIVQFVPQGVRLKDGSLLPAELLVVATGYKNQQEVVRASLGDAVADRVGPAWDFDDGGELRNMWRPTAQPGLWFTAGSLAQCRIFSHYLALQIQANLRQDTGR
jgi:cation diffusion facilitator CzcD-associated flavoprotein CzcO